MKTVGYLKDIHLGEIYNRFDFIYLILELTELWKVISIWPAEMVSV